MSASMGGWTLASVLWVVASAPATAAEIAWRAPIWGPKRASSESLVWLAKEVALKGREVFEFTQAKIREFSR